MNKLSITVGCVALVIGSCCLRADDAPVAAQPKVMAAVQAGISYLSQQQQQTDGSWKVDSDNYSDGVSALCALALLNGGVDVQDERVQRALRWLRGREPKLTYSRVLQTRVYCRVKAPEDVDRIRQSVAWLVEAQAKDGEGKGGWSYGPTSGGRGDGSCTRFAMWALDAARRADVKVSEDVWRMNADYWLGSQHEDGAWSYTPNGTNGTATMTLSGIFCLAAIKDAVADDALHARIDHAIDRPWKRPDQWSQDSPPSYLKSHGFRFYAYQFYAYQLLGLAARQTGRDKFRDVEWKPAATQLLLSDQQADSGRWTGEPVPGGSQPVISTSLALLFLTEN